MKLQNTGTKIRTICLVIVLINQANASLSQMEFNNPKLDAIYKLFSWALTVVAGVAAWYYNNDTSEPGSIGTGITRQIKAELSKDYVGERFFTNSNGQLLAKELPVLSEDDIVEEEDDE